MKISLQDQISLITKSLEELRELVIVRNNAINQIPIAKRMTEELTKKENQINSLIKMIPEICSNTHKIGDRIRFKNSINIDGGSNLITDPKCEILEGNIISIYIRQYYNNCGDYNNYILCYEIDCGTHVFVINNTQILPGT